MPKVQMPDGILLDFPDNTPADVIQQQAHGYYLSTQPKSTPDTASPVPQEDGGFWEGYGNAFAKLGVGAKQRVLELAQTMGSDAAVEELKKINDLAKRLDKSSEGKGFANKAGQFAGNVVPAMATPVGGSIPAAIGIAGVTGAVQEFIQPNTQDMTPGESLAKKSLDAGISGGVSALAVPVISAISGGGKAAYNWLKPKIPGMERAVPAVDDIIKQVAKESPDVAQSVAKESPEVIQGFASSVKAGLPPEQALLKAKADSYGVRVSKGDITGDLMQQSQEEAALKGMIGQDTQSIAQSFREGQSNDLRGMATNVGKKVGGGQDLPPDMQSVADRIAATIKKSAVSEKKVASAAYNNAGLDKARIDVENIATYRNALRSELGKEGFSKDLTPTAYNVYSRLDRYLSDAKKKGLNTINLQHVEGFRKLMNKVGGNAQPADARMLGIMKDTLDTSLDDALEQGLINGNEKAIDNIKNARELWKSYKQRYYGSDGKAIIGRIVDKNLTPEKTMQLLIGTGKAGGKTEAATTVSQLKKVLGENSPEFNSLRQEVFKRLVGQDLEKIAVGDVPKSFSGLKFQNNVKEFMKTNKSLAQELYGAETWKTIEDAANFANRVTTKKDGVINYSNTTPALVRFINNTSAKFGPIGRYIAAPAVGGIEKVSRQAAKRSAQEAFSPTAKNMVPESNDFVQALSQRAGIASGVGASEIRQNMEKNTKQEEGNLNNYLQGIKIINPYE